MIALRDYQAEALDAIVAAAARGVRRQLVVLPTGTGKTILFAELIKRRPGRAIVLVHRDELARQAVDKIRLVIPAAAIGGIKAERNETTAPILVASVQTLARETRLQQVPPCDTVIIDEAHHAAADTYQKILSTIPTPEALVLGVTATADRGDGRGLDAVFNEIVYSRDLLTMIRAGYLSDLRGVRVGIPADLGNLHVRAGDYVASEAEELLLGAGAPAHAVRAYQEHAPGRQALVFTPGVRLAHAMAEAFVGAGIQAAAVDGAMPLDDRRQALEQFHRGALRVVANCQVLTEGYDEPATDCIVIARPTRSRGLYVQMVGRGTRIHPGKADCLVIDLVGAASRHDLVTLPTLAGVEMQPDETLLDALDRQEAAQRQADDDANQHARIVAREVDLFRRRRLHWIRAGDVWVIACGEGQIHLRPTGAETWTATYTDRHDRHVIAADVPLAYAQGSAEDYVRQAGVPAAFVDPRAPWRKRPATDKQVDRLRRWRIAIRPDLTCGEAADLITAYIARKRAS